MFNVAVVTKHFSLWATFYEDKITQTTYPTIPAWYCEKET